MWQHHTFTASSYKIIKNDVVAKDVGGIVRSFPLRDLLWVSEGATIQLCYRLKVASSGIALKKKPVKSAHEGFATAIAFDGCKLLVNKKLHRLITEDA